MIKKEKCPSCGRPWVHPKKLIEALGLVKSGYRPATAARCAGISRQLLYFHMKKSNVSGGNFKSVEGI